VPAEPPTSAAVDAPAVQPGWTAGSGPGRHLPGRTGRPPAPPRPASGPSMTLDGQGSTLDGWGSTPSTAGSGPSTTLDGRVSALDRLTLHLGVVVGVLIALCSYAVSATSLYALGRAAGYAPWQALAVPVVADGPAVYGMARIVSRSRRGARGAGYGWLLVGCGTAASVAGNVAHAQPGWVARGIAAAIPLAVLAMLEGLKGDAREVVRLATPDPSSPDNCADPPVQPDTLDPSRDRPVDTTTTTVRRVDSPDTLAARMDGRGVRQLPARTPPSDTRLDGRVRDRLAAVHAAGRPDSGAWTARTLAQAAGCGRSTAAAFLAAHRARDGEGGSG
jgi:Protein of unknown function (DUF2637)